MNKEDLLNAVNRGISVYKISILYNVSPSKVTYWLKKFSLKTKIINKWEESNIRSAIIGSNTKTEILIKMGLSTKSSNFQKLDIECFKLQIKLKEILSINLNNRVASDKTIKNDDEIFCENSLISRNQVIRRIKKKSLLISDRCTLCYIGEIWNGKKLTLQLDHINGINNDNRLENLRFLCPNCHTQTTTFGGSKLRKEFKCKCGNKMDKASKKCKLCNSNERKQKAENKYSIDELLVDVQNLGYFATGIKYKVSDNTIRKWLGDKVIKKNKNRGTTKCLDCNKIINYGSKRCEVCNRKLSKSNNPPDLNLLKKEFEEHGITWCGDKYKVDRRVINKWIYGNVTQM